MSKLLALRRYAHKNWMEGVFSSCIVCHSSTLLSSKLHKANFVAFNLSITPAYTGDRLLSILRILCASFDKERIPYMV